jgi:hypothetical protein
VYCGKIGGGGRGTGDGGEVDEGEDRQAGWLQRIAAYGGYAGLIALAAAIWAWSF